MHKYFINYKKFIPFILLIIIISLLGVFVFGIGNTKAADALGIVDGFKTLLGGFLLMIQELIGSLVAWFAGLAQGILNFTNLQNSQMVKDGWEITRGLVNMFFILILMIIALATIFKVESYGMKTLLPKLIIAALLINFSLVFCGAIIDSAGVLTNFFIKDSKNFFENIADEMGLTTIMVGTVQKPAKSQWACDWALLPDKVWGNQTVCNVFCVASTGNTCYEAKPPKVDWSKIQGDRFWKVIAALFLSIIFTIIAAFVFAALAFLLLIRVLVIWFLLILAPIAWFFWILPATKNLWEQWWNAFIKWVFFAPAAIFFIWLSVNSWLKFIQGKAPLSGGEMIEGMSNVVSNSVLESKIMPQVMAPANFIQFILACGMLIGSLIVAQKIGIYGADGAISVTKSIGKGLGKFSWKSSKAGVAALGKAPGLKKIPKVEDMKRGIMAKAERIPIIGRSIGGPGAYQSKQIGKIQEERKKIANRTPEDLERIKNQTVFTKEDRIRKVAAMEELAEKGKLTGTYKENEKDLKMFKQTGGDINKVIKYRPDFAPINKEAGDTPEQAIRKAVSKIKPADIEKIQIEALTPDVIVSIEKELTDKDGRWKGGHLAKAAESNPVVFSKIKEDILENTKRITNPLRKAIEDYLVSDAGKAVTG